MMNSEELLQFLRKNVKIGNPYTFEAEDTKFVVIKNNDDLYALSNDIGFDGARPRYKTTELEYELLNKYLYSWFLDELEIQEIVSYGYIVKKPKKYIKEEYGLSKAL